MSSTWTGSRRPMAEPPGTTRGAGWDSAWLWIRPIRISFTQPTSVSRRQPTVVKPGGGLMRAWAMLRSSLWRSTRSTRRCCSPVVSVMAPSNQLMAVALGLPSISTPPCGGCSSTRMMATLCTQDPMAMAFIKAPTVAIRSHASARLKSALSSRS